ncbi:MAG: hypothetical protein HKP38_01620 [Croceitalea sp.]|nr:hypothetical protein [Croceitalea sp.]
MATVGFVFIIYWIVILKSIDFEFDFSLLWPNIGGLIFLILTFLAINPIIKDDKLAENSSYAMLFYVLMLLNFTSILAQEGLLISNFFVVVSTGKVLSLKFDKRQNYHIFEAAFFVFLAGIFNEWALLFLIPLYFAIYAYTNKQIRGWLMPLAAFVSVFLPLMALVLVTGNADNLLNNFHYDLGFDFSFKEYLGRLLFLAVMLAIIAIVFAKLGNRGIGRAVSLRILMVYFIIAMVVTFFSANNGTTVIFSFFAAAVFLTNYFETIKKKKISEIILVVFVATSLTVAIFHLIQ